MWQMATIAMAGLLLWIGDASAEENLMLTCSGNYSQWGENAVPRASVDASSMVLDWQASRATFFGAEYLITRNEANSIGLMTPLVADGVPVGMIEGQINRLTGDTTIFARRASSPDQVVFMFELTCLPAKPLF